MYGGPIPVPTALNLPSGRQSLVKRLRRAWRSRKALSGVTQWIIDWGLPVALTLTVLFLSAALTREATPSDVYHVFTLIDEPKHLLLWLASVAGWLLVPAIIGGFAGHVITTRIQRTKSTPAATLFQQRKLSQRLRPPGLIDDLAGYFHGTYAQKDFVDAWVRVAHRNDWTRAQDHWEVYVRDTMSTPQYAHLHRRECLRRAQESGRILLRFTGRAGRCIVCERRQ
nr:DUF6313 family protein [Streptomyces harenosi]